ncbi:proline synthase co-transcribed bacterial protein [Elysia marginata]|uniref:Proline synthase co-transcribed bacterial protein n=1 Tax=Elysia marginata TaxID=1093978 RepID=A0AAV4JNN1_9GAST|nr:proline synthase co-transcribed bacterial protein [Elysia marginata]
MAKTFSDLDTPCFLVDLDKVKQNAQRMLDTCARLNLQLRAHTKTHKTLCLALVEKLDKFHVMVSGPDGLATLKAHTENLPAGKKWSIVLEVDCGYGRTGFAVWGQEVIDAALVITKSASLELEAIYCHCGDLYSVRSKQLREAQQKRNAASLCGLQEKLKKFGVSCKFGTGSTPTCSLPIEFNRNLSEFHPGAYIFYDYEQYLLNACKESDIACRVMTRVVAHKPELNMIIVDCGFTAISHDGMAQRLPDADFCLIQGEANLKMIGMSQELGKIVAKEGDLDCSQYPIGTILFIFPYHTCAAAAMHKEYFVHCADTVVTTWTPVRGW